MTSPLRSSVRSPSLHPRTGLPPWMKPCRASCCRSPVIGEKEEEGFATALVTTRSARWSTQQPGMPAGGSSMIALTALKDPDTRTAELAYHALASGSAALTFRWLTAAGDSMRAGSARQGERLGLPVKWATFFFVQTGISQQTLV